MIGVMHSANAVILARYDAGERDVLVVMYSAAYGKKYQYAVIASYFYGLCILCHARIRWNSSVVNNIAFFITYRCNIKHRSIRVCRKIFFYYSIFC